MSEGCCFTGELHSSVYESGLAVDREKELVNIFLVTSSKTILHQNTLIELA